LYDKFKWDGSDFELNRLHKEVLGIILNSNYTRLVDWTPGGGVKYNYSK
jgi:hypothetical protein